MHSKPTISEEVLQKIKQGNVRMKPRVYFVLLSGMTVLAVLGSSFSIAYLTSILVYWLRIQTASTMAYGARRNLSEALATFPWWMVIMAVGFTILAVVLVRNRGTMYRHRPSVIAMSIIGISCIFGLFLYTIGVGSQGGMAGINQGGVRHSQNRLRN